jgi:hypothetical protein
MMATFNLPTLIFGQKGAKLPVQKILFVGFLNLNLKEEANR